jgi:predicted ATPase
MINEIDIRNFRCFQRLHLGNCKRVNVIVGDNGAGKTSLLEAVFLALGSTTDLAVRFRQTRGLDGNFRGSARNIADALLGDIFYKYDQSQEVSVTLTGSGPEARSVRLLKGPSETRLPLEDTAKIETSAPFHFIWTDATGREYDMAPTISVTGLQFPETGEDLADFFYFAANQTYSSTDNADRFSKMSRAKRHIKFIDLFKNEYPWIEDIAIEVTAGQPALYASIAGVDDKIALSNVSGGINRIATVLLAMASRPRSVVLVDELENGLYYKHYQAYWEHLLSFVRAYDSQLFVTTHSAEWLHALVAAANEKNDDIALWRIERDDLGNPEFFQFDGATLHGGLELGAEVRGGAE